jgi:hypothetical protein
MAKEKKTTSKSPKSTPKKKELVGDLFEEIQKEKQGDNTIVIDETNPVAREIVLYESNEEEAKEPQTAAEVINTKEKLKSFDFGKNIYLQLHKANIYSIFSSAIIAPAKYIKNRAFSDTQSLDENLLILSNGNISDIDETQVLLEINFKASEEKIISPVNAVAFTLRPLPISRIKKIYVASESVKKDIVSTSLTADGGIIPEQLIQSSFPNELSQADFTKLTTEYVKDISTDIQRFDKILGAFAYLKNYSWLLVNKTDQLNIVPQHFFYMANAVSNYSDFQKHKNERATLFYRKLFGIQNEIEKPFLKWIFTRLNTDKNFTDNDTKDFGSKFLTTIQNKDFQSNAKKLLNDLTDSLKRKKAIQEIWQQQDSDKSFLYLFSFLRNYGNANTEDKSTSRKDIPEIITTDPFIGEYVFACLGYFYGYKLLRNFEERINISDKYISDFAELARPLPLKFELTTLFDYAVIESVYQLVFNSINDTDNFQIIESPSIKRELVRRANNLPSDYTFTSDEVLGKYNYMIKRKSAIDDAIEHLSKISEPIPVVSELGVYLLRNSVSKNWISFPELMTHTDKWKYIVSFKREQIIDAMRIGKINPKELIQRIDISKQTKEF